MKEVVSECLPKLSEVHHLSQIHFKWSPFNNRQSGAPVGTLTSSKAILFMSVKAGQDGAQANMQDLHTNRPAGQEAIDSGNLYSQPSMV